MVQNKKMTLLQWMAQLPKGHLANKQFDELVAQRDEAERYYQNVLDACKTVGLVYYPASTSLRNERAEAAERKNQQLREALMKLAENWQCGVERGEVEKDEDHDKLCPHCIARAALEVKP